jgi:hypothetical protein
MDSIYGRVINTLPPIGSKVSFLWLIITVIFILSEIMFNSFLGLTKALANSLCSLCHVHKLLISLLKHDIYTGRPEI